MAKNFQKAERNIKIDGEYKLLSYASSSESVEMTDGTDLQIKMDSVDNDISNEVSRATTKENEIANNLSAEITRAKNSEALKAPLASPTLTGTPKAPTASAGTNTTQIATTAFVQNAIEKALKLNVTDDGDGNITIS